MLAILSLLCVPLFGLAALRDYRAREVPNRYWLPVAGLGAVLLAARDVKAWGPIIVNVAAVWAFALAVWYAGMGGADAKGIMALAIVYPSFSMVFVIVCIALALTVVYVALTRSWRDPGVPFMIPLTIALAFVLPLVVLLPHLPA